MDGGEAAAPSRGVAVAGCFTSKAPRPWGSGAASVRADEIWVAGQEVHDVARCADALALDRLERAAAYVRGDDHVVDAGERMVSGRRLLGEDVGGVATERARL